MGLYKIEAVVLRRRNLGEADRLVTVLSRDRGKIVLAARGARRPRSRLGGRLEPPTRFRALVAEGRTLDVVSQVEVLDAHARLRREIERMGPAHVMLEMADRALADRHPHPDVYALLRDALSLLGAGCACAGLWFAARLLVLTGHRPVVGHCPVCGLRVRGEGRWSNVLGGCVHAGCCSRDPDAVQVAPAAQALLRFLLDASPSAVRRLAPAPGVRSAVADLLFAYAEACWETRLRSPAVVRALSMV